MLRRINFYSVCFAFGLSVLLILAGNRYTDNTNYHPLAESRRNGRNFLKVEYGDSLYNQPLATNLDDGSPDFEKILDNTRLRIQTDLMKYNFTYSGVQSLDDLLMELGGKPKRNIIISTWRSGTTFLGEVLDAVPGNFYHYEPLLRYEIIQIRGPPHAEQALESIINMLKCNYKGMEEYFNFGKNNLHQFVHNTRLWQNCKYRNELCLDADFTSKFCKLFPFQSMKVVRVRLRLIEDILKDQDLNSKVVLLVRDPRGVMQSRQHRTFCPPAPDCWRAELLCADMVSDYVAAARLIKQYPGKLTVVRYEELALSPNATTKEIFKFLGLSVTASVEQFLHSHTSVEVAGVSSTFRVSREVPFKWRHTLDYDYVEDIQNSCKEAMGLWGYNMANNASEMASKDFNPLLPYTISE